MQLDGEDQQEKREIRKKLEICQMIAVYKSTYISC